ICAGDCFSYVQFDYSGTARFDGAVGDSFEQRYDGCAPLPTLKGTPDLLSFTTGVRSYDAATCPRPSGFFANVTYTLTTA
ncbi:hypothetical protein, partial [Streptococcus pneumoniae]|uniref:hypothetical protein n=1 Tax=Streptococcus pneumoniae TaxID=1313 RepID=UPI001E365C82